MAVTWPTPSTPDEWWTQFHDLYGRASTLESAFQGYLASQGLAPNPSVDELQSCFQEFQTFMEMSVETDAANPVAEPKAPPTTAQLAYVPSTPPPREGRLPLAPEDAPAVPLAAYARPEATATLAGDPSQAERRETTDQALAAERDPAAPAHETPPASEPLQEPYDRTVRRPRG